METNRRVLLKTIHYRQNRKGKPMRVCREKYLREDVNCGSFGCEICPTTNRSQYKLDHDPPIYSKKYDIKHYLLPDASFITRQTDVLEELSNVILLQTVVEDVAKSNLSKYKRVRDGIKNRKMVYYLNDHSKDTYVSRKPGEGQDERNFRAFLESYAFFQRHFADRGINVVILSDDPAFLSKCKTISPSSYDSILACTGEEYVTTMTEQFKDLEDKLCRVPFSEDTDVRKERGEFSFDPHLSAKAVQDGIKSGMFIQGAFRARNFYEGFVRVDGDSPEAKEYLLQGIKNLNRATDGDIIAIKVLPESEWSVESGVVDVDVDEEAPITAEGVATGDEVEEQILAIAADSKKKSSQLIKPTAKVVGIIRRKWPPCCGVIQKSLHENALFHYFIPDNKKIPRVRIETRNIERFEGQKIVVQIDQWPATSRFPVGHYTRILGPVGTIETETEAVLHEHDVPHDPFSKAVEACLPTLPYTIPDEEYATRKSFKDLIVCSVDPPGCTDIDDTLHCRELDDGTYEVGVHIADVSHYVKPRTALDAEAAKRGTSVYLADRRIDMIPAVLSSNLCSLHANTEKLVFSVIWKMNKNAKILQTNFYKAIIQSKAAMTYSEAQAKLNSKDTDEITLSLKRLSSLAQILRQRRFEMGALMLNTTEISADGEAEDNDEESHAMVEEFMLLANCSVAEFTLREFRDCALLRRHPIPPPANFEPLLLAAKTHGLTIVVDKGSKALNESIQNQADDLKDILKVLTTRCMTQALYCCSGTTSNTEYEHFGLASKLYTHFTSPIRRYADLMVHRLLAAAIRVEAPDPKLLDPKLMHDICENINFRHRMAQYASRSSYNIHKSKNLKGKKEEHHAFVMFVRRNALQIFVPQYGMEGFIFYPKTGGYVYNEKDGQVKFGDVRFRPLDKIRVMLSLEEEKDKVVYQLVSPHVPSLAGE